nr:unnamed protein product [Fasciola hepatica]
MVILEDQIWMIVVGFLVAFVLAFGLGANDVANTFGSSVGSGVLTLKQACILATICEMSGAVLLGAKVSNTLRKGIVDIQLFSGLENGAATLMAGQVAALGGSCIWLLVATFLRLPVSGTHSIVGATVGFSLVIFGVKAIQWMGLVRIVASWFISPVLSGLISVGIFYIIHFLVLTKEESYEPGLRVLPGFYGAVVFVNAFSIVYGAPPMSCEAPAVSGHVTARPAKPVAFGLAPLCLSVSQSVIEQMCVHCAQCSVGMRATVHVRHASGTFPSNVTTPVTITTHTFHTHPHYHHSSNQADMYDHASTSNTVDSSTAMCSVESTPLSIEGAFLGQTEKSVLLSPSLSMCLPNHHLRTGAHTHTSNPGFKFEHIPLWGIFILSAGLGCITVILVKLLMIPYLREKFLANESTSPKWSMRLGNEISKTTARLTACCRRNTVNRHAKAKIDNGDSVKSAQAEYGANRKRIPSELAMISENPLDEGTEMQPVFSRPPLSDGSETVNNSFVCGGGDHVPGNSTSSVTAGRMKIQRIKHSAANMPGRTRTTESARVFEITPTSVDAKAPDFADGTMSVTKRTVLAQPSLPPIGEEPEARDQIKDRPSEARVFSLLQVMTAVFGSFAHGGNDVSNAIGPLIGLWIVGVTHEVDSKMPIPVWLLVYGGVGISIGLCLWGRRVIQTLGEDLARITPSSGVCIEIGSALTVLLASKVGLPVSTTHCQVGSVVGVGRARSRDNVNWSIFRNIIIAWVVTVPAAAGVSALLMYCFTFLV